jgi:hypothetical protein
MNDTGRAMLINAICYIARFTEDRPIVHTPCVFVQGKRIVELLDSPEPLAMYQFTHGSLVGLWGDLETAEEQLRSAIARFRC